MSELTFPPRRDPLPRVPPIEERLNENAAARYLGVKSTTLKNWRHQSRGPSYFKCGRIFYWRRDLDEWLLARRVEHDE